MAPPALRPEPGRAIDTASTGWSSRATRHSTCRQTRTVAWPGWSVSALRPWRSSQRRRQGGGDGDTDSWYRYVVLRDGSTYVRWRTIGEFLVAADGRRIMFRRFDRASLESFQVYLLGQALSFALVRQGFEPLHATAVVVDRHAVAFLGSNAFGKSSLAACFLEAGARLLTDDLLILGESRNRVLAYPGPPRLKLFPKIARRFLGQDAANRVHMNPDTDKLILPIEEHRRQGRPIALDAIYALAAPRDACRTPCVRVETPVAARGLPGAAQGHLQPSSHEPAAFGSGNSASRPG